MSSSSGISIPSELKTRLTNISVRLDTKIKAKDDGFGIDVTDFFSKATMFWSKWNFIIAPVFLGLGIVLLLMLVGLAVTFLPILELLPDLSFFLFVLCTFATILVPGLICIYFEDCGDIRLAHIHLYQQIEDFREMIESLDILGEKSMNTMVISADILDAIDVLDKRIDNYCSTARRTYVPYDWVVIAAELNAAIKNTIDKCKGMVNAHNEFIAHDSTIETAKNGDQLNKRVVLNTGDRKKSLPERTKVAGLIEKFNSIYRDGNPLNLHGSGFIQKNDNENSEGSLCSRFKGPV